MNETYICSYARTPIGAFKGSLSTLSATKLGSIVIKAALDKSLLDSNLVDEVIMGNVLSANLGQAPARQASIGANLPTSVECMTINKVCGSGLKSVMLADNSVKLNNSDIVIAGGMENMSRAPYYLNNGRGGLSFGNDKLIDSIIYDGLWDPYNNILMGNCGEILCKEKKYSREDQDEYAIDSYSKAKKAIDKGLFKDEIIKVKINDKKGSKIIDIDEEPLKFNKKKFLNLKPAFDKNGTITAANASSLSDGAAAVLIASSKKVEEYKLKPIAKIIGQASFATDPIYFTKAPIYAIEKVLNNANLTIEDIDLFEINEAFSCVPLVAIDELNIPINKVNIHGGAVSLGHPIGASGTRILVTLLNALKLNNLKYGVASLCIGGGEASALIVEMCS